MAFYGIDIAYYLIKRFRLTTFRMAVSLLFDDNLQSG